MIDLVLVKSDMLCYEQDVRAVRGMGQGLSGHHVVQCKFRLIGAWIKRREVVAGARRMRSEKLREDWYREGYSRSLEGRVGKNQCFFFNQKPLFFFNHGFFWF